MKIFLLVFLTIIVNLFSACSSSVNGTTIVVSDPWVRSAGGAMGNMGQEGEMSKPNGGAFMVIKDPGRELDRLVKAESDIADAVEIHKTEMVDDVMKMSPVDSIEIPAGDKVELKPGGYHVMFIGLNQVLKTGDKVKITLTFEKAGSQTIEAEVPTP